jgi:hypothetical protein
VPLALLCSSFFAGAALLPPLIALLALLFLFPLPACLPCTD